MRLLGLPLLLVASCCCPESSTADPTSTTTTTTTTSGSGSEPACGPVVPCVDEEGAASLEAQCEAQHSGQGRAIACPLDEAELPAGCVELAMVAPLRCLDDSARRVGCCAP